MALLVPSTIIFLILVSASHASLTSQVEATITVFLGAEFRCQPNPLIVGSVESRFTCLIELSNSNVSKIIPGSLRLSLDEIPVIPLPVAADSPNSVGDFDNDGRTEMKVTFVKKEMEGWFPDPILPQFFTFVMNGSVQGEQNSFTASESILVINPSITLVKFLGVGGQIGQIGGIDLTKATITGSSIDGTVTRQISYSRARNGTISGLVIKVAHISDDIDGTAPITFLGRTLFSAKFSTWARYDGSNCTAIYPDRVTCEGLGRLFKSFPFGLFEEGAYIRFSTDGNIANITASQGGSMVYEHTDIPLKSFNFWVS
jgi:hypothetical protein